MNPQFREKKPQKDSVSFLFPHSWRFPWTRVLLNSSGVCNVCQNNILIVPVLQISKRRDQRWTGLHDVTKASFHGSGRMDKSCSRLKAERLLRTQVVMGWKKKNEVGCNYGERSRCTDFTSTFPCFIKTTMTSGALLFEVLIHFFNQG